MSATLRSLGGRKGSPFTVTPAGTPTDVGMPVWWWIPGRSRARRPDPDFVARLKDIDRRLDLGWNPEDGCWEVWYKSGEKQVAWTDGWKRLLTGIYRLDNRTFHALYERDNNSFGSAIAWFNQVEAQRDRDRASRQREHDSEIEDTAKDYWQYTKIKSTSHGGKFHRHHSGG